MKSLNHRITAIAFLAFSNASLPELGYTFFMASIPDQIEHIGRRPALKHRGWSHNLILWTALLVFLAKSKMVPSMLFSYPVNDYFFTFRTWVLAYPGFIHVMMDALTPNGVPLLGRFRIRIPIFNYGKWKEYVFSWLCFGVSLFLYASVVIKSFVLMLKRVLTLL